MRITDKHLLEGALCTVNLCHDKDSGLFGADRPDTVVIHFTGGSSVSSAVTTLRDPSVEASAHLVVGQQGEVVQLVPFNKIAWHAGKSSYGGRTGLNRYAIGIEIDNPGRLTRAGDEYISWFGGKYPPEKVITAVHRNETQESHWHVYSKSQIETVFNLCRLLRDHYQITTIVGHEEISPGRKIDPGPAFPLERLRDTLLRGASRRIDGPAELPASLTVDEQAGKVVSGTVTASSLNIRALPDRNAPKVLPPLAHASQVEILREEHGWYHVRVSRNGWVKKEFVALVRQG